MFGWGVYGQAVDDRGAVEADDDRHPAGDGGRLEPADLLHPPHVELDLRAGRGERVEAAVGAPAEVGAQVGLRVRPRHGLVPGQVAGDGELQHSRISYFGRKNLRSCHTCTVRRLTVEETAHPSHLCGLLVDLCASMVSPGESWLI